MCIFRPPADSRTCGSTFCPISSGRALQCRAAWRFSTGASWPVSPGLSAEALYLQALLLLTESGSGSTSCGIVMHSPLLSSGIWVWWCRDPLGGRPVLVPVELDDEGVTWKYFIIHNFPLGDVNMFVCEDLDTDWRSICGGSQRVQFCCPYL